MENKYQDLIEQTFDFPQESFEVIDNELYFNDIPLMDIIKQYGTPLKITYLPKNKKRTISSLTNNNIYLTFLKQTNNFISPPFITPRDKNKLVFPSQCVV